MWLITPVGFFSVVRKPTDIESKTLTVRARVRSDLEALKAQYLPELSTIQESHANDYRFRATAPQAAVAAAMAHLVEDLDYANFKDEVKTRQGTARACLYHEVWDVLYGLQKEPAKHAQAPKATRKARDSTVHPRPDDDGNPVVIRAPSQASDMTSWSDPNAVACLVPDGAVPAEINGVRVARWADAPQTQAEWEALAASHPVDELEFIAPMGYKKATGAVIREADGRIWLVAPSNAFGGYQATFPKGTMDGQSAQATALVETFEETGLRVRLVKHLIDVKRSQSYTRYYLAERVGGSPADMGWESQAVMLAPLHQLGSPLNSPHDTPILKLLMSAA